MTNIQFFKKNEYFVKLEVNGHTGFAPRGSDTLCAAISAIIQAGALGIQNVLNIAATVRSDEKTGSFLIQLPNQLSKDALAQTQLLFLTMLEALRDLESGYSKFIQLEVKQICL